jgi:large subunit ribosomal protein L31
MKTAIHPKYQKSRVTCVCGNIMDTFSTKGDFSVEVCAACHPFFTGKVKLLDVAGRVEKFNNRSDTAVKVQAELKAREEARAVAEAAKKAKRKGAVKEAVAKVEAKPEVKAEVKVETKPTTSSPEGAPKN